MLCLLSVDDDRGKDDKYKDEHVYCGRYTVGLPIAAKLNSQLAYKALDHRMS